MMNKFLLRTILLGSFLLPVHRVDRSKMVAPRWWIPEGFLGLQTRFINHSLTKKGHPRHHHHGACEEEEQYWFPQASPGQIRESESYFKRDVTTKKVWQLNGPVWTTIKQLQTTQNHESKRVVQGNEIQRLLSRLPRGSLGSDELDGWFARGNLRTLFVQLSESTTHLGCINSWFCFECHLYLIIQ